MALERTGTHTPAPAHALRDVPCYRFSWQISRPKYCLEMIEFNRCLHCARHGTAWHTDSVVTLDACCRHCSNCVSCIQHHILLSLQYYCP